MTPCSPLNPLYCAVGEVLGFTWDKLPQALQETLNGLPLSTLWQYYQFCQECGITFSSALQFHPGILSVSPRRLLKLKHIFDRYNIDTGKVIRNYAKIMTFAPAVVAKSVKLFSSAQLDVIQIVAKNPAALGGDPSTLTHHLGFYEQFGPLRKKILETQPILLTKPIAEITAVLSLLETYHIPRTRVLEKCPDLLLQEKTHIENQCQLLRRYTTDLVATVIAHPHLLIMKQERLETIFSLLDQWKIPIATVLAQNPQCLSLRVQQLQARIIELKQSTLAFRSVISQCPRILSIRIRHLRGRIKGIQRIAPEWQQMVEKAPSLLIFPKPHLETLLQTLSAKGISLTEIITLHPAWLTLDPQEIIANWTHTHHKISPSPLPLSPPLPQQAPIESASPALPRTRFTGTSPKSPKSPKNSLYFVGVCDFPNYKTRQDPHHRLRNRVPVRGLCTQIVKKLQHHFGAISPIILYFFFRKRDSKVQIPLEVFPANFNVKIDIAKPYKKDGVDADIDFHMVTDSMTHFVNHTHDIDRVCLLSGDGDYIPMMRKVRLLGLHPLILAYDRHSLNEGYRTEGFDVDYLY